MSDKKITLGQAIDRIIEALEPLKLSARQTAINAACSHLEIQISPVERQSLNEPQNLPPNTINNPPSGGKVVDIRTLKDQKNPKTASQMACVIAYYVQELAPQTERALEELERGSDVGHVDDGVAELHGREMR